MKKIRLFTMMAVTLLCALTSCEFESKIWDIYPLNIEIKVRDKNGNDLLNPASESNIIGSDSFILYDGGRHDVKWNWDPSNDTRAYYAHFYGIRHMNECDVYIGNADEWFLTIGEFFRDDNYEKSLTISLKGQEHVIRFKNKYSTTWDGTPKIKTEIYVDNQRHKDGGPIILTLLD